MSERENGNGHFDHISAREEFFQPIVDETQDLDPIHWARVRKFEVSPEANVRCGREIVEGQFAILKLIRINSELRLSDELRLRVQEVLTGQKVGTLFDGFNGRIGNEKVSLRFAESHEQFVHMAALRCAEIECEIGKLKKRGPIKREKAIHEVLRCEAEKILTAEEAFDEITLRNMQLAMHVAKKYKGYSSLPLSDLFQAANIGIMLAAARYDFNGAQFITYAHEWAMKEVKSAIADCDGVIRLPETARVELAKNLRKIEEKEQEIGRVLIKSELDEVLLCVRGKLIGEREEHKGRKLTGDELDQMLTEARDKFFDSIKSGDMCLLSEPVRLESGDGDVELGDMIVSEEPAVDEVVTRFMVGSGVRMVINEVLTRRERLASDLRFGISDGRPQTLEDVGKRFGITREGFRKAQIETFKKLRRDARLRQLYEMV